MASPLSPKATTPLSFRKLMALQEVESAKEGCKTFSSIAPAWAPGAGTTAFGGHVYAQAAWAASRTVGVGMVIHNVTGFFILPGRIDVPFIYKVRKVRDGGVYGLRAVEAYQVSVEESSGSRSGSAKVQKNMSVGDKETTAQTPCFTATVSFKRKEDSTKYTDFRYQTPSISAGHLRNAYGKVLSDQKPEDQPIAPAADAMWWTQGLDSGMWTEVDEKFPGVEIRKVDMSRYNKGFGSPVRAGEWRQLSFYRLIKDVGQEIDDDETSTLNLHTCAHLYASDRNSLFLITRALGFQDQLVAMSSLSHTVIFHGDPLKQLMCDQQGKPIWCLQEAWTENGGLNRGCHESRLWRLDDGGKDEIIATTKQDGMIRVPADSNSAQKMFEKRRMKMSKINKGKL